jgi:hypothetical protein
MAKAVAFSIRAPNGSCGIQSCRHGPFGVSAGIPTAYSGRDTRILNITVQKEPGRPDTGKQRLACNGSLSADGQSILIGNVMLKMVPGK